MRAVTGTSLYFLSIGLEKPVEPFIDIRTLASRHVNQGANSNGLRIPQLANAGT
jgi:hypothetical protein